MDDERLIEQCLASNNVATECQVVDVNGTANSGKN